MIRAVSEPSATPQARSVGAPEASGETYARVAEAEGQAPADDLDDAPTARRSEDDSVRDEPGLGAALAGSPPPTAPPEQQPALPAAPATARATMDRRLAPEPLATDLAAPARPNPPPATDLATPASGLSARTAAPATESVTRAADAAMQQSAELAPTPRGEIRASAATEAQSARVPAAVDAAQAPPVADVRRDAHAPPDALVRPATVAAAKAATAAEVPASAAAAPGPPPLAPTPASAARVDVAALEAALGRVLRRLLNASAPDEREAQDEPAGVTRLTPWSGLAAQAPAGAPFGASALTANAVTAPEAATRSAAVADALAHLHVDDGAVAVIRVERTGIGAIEAHVTRHAGEVTVRLRALDPEQQTQLLQALPAVRRELDASQLVVGRVDVRGDGFGQSFGPSTSDQRSAEREALSGPEDDDAVDLRGAVPPPRRAGPIPPQLGERRRLLVIA